MKLSIGSRLSARLGIWSATVAGLVFVALFCLLLLGTGCTTTPAPVTVSPEAPPAQAALEEQFAAQVESLKSESSAKSQQLDAVAASACAIQLVGIPNTPASDGKPVIERETALIVATAGEPTPEARAAALERANAQLRQDLARANVLYGQATAKAQQLNQQLAAAAREISARDQQLEELRRTAAAERTRLAAEMQAKIDAQAKAFADYKAEQARTDRSLWVNTLRFGGLALVVVGIGLIALSKGTLIVQGGLLALGGAGVIGVGMAYDIVSSQPWYPWAVSLLALAVVGAGGWAVWRAYRQGTLGTQLAAAVNDLKTEAETAGSASAESWKTLQEHLAYRLGQAGSSAQAELKKLWTKLGLDTEDKS